jgi:hypothetical protein
MLTGTSKRTSDGVQATVLRREHLCQPPQNVTVLNLTLLTTASRPRRLSNHLAERSSTALVRFDIRERRSAYIDRPRWPIR